jgi:hypothetical protein
MATDVGMGAKFYEPSFDDFLDIKAGKHLFTGYADHPHGLSRMNIIIAAAIVAVVLILVLVSVIVSARGTVSSQDRGGVGSSD